jgi:hypothetical protein
MARDSAADRMRVCAVLGTDNFRWRVNDCWTRVGNLEVKKGKVSHEKEKCVELIISQLLQHLLDINIL